MINKELLERYVFDSSFKYGNYNFLVEGLNVIERHVGGGKIERKVTLTDEHSKGVDFVTSPIYYTFRGWNVISIFKRTQLQNERSDVDGNPFIYALKGLHNYSFDITNEDAYKYMKRFLKNCSKIDKVYDTIITVPSGHDINNRFMKSLASIIHAKYKIEKWFIKSKIEFAEESIDYDAICNDYKYQHQIDYVFEQLYAALSKMEGGYFKSKQCPKEYVKYVKDIVTFDKSKISDVAPMIDGKNVLILDDTISSGESISRCASNIIETFNPKKVTLVTLLSKKM